MCIILSWRMLGVSKFRRAAERMDSSHLDLSHKKLVFNSAIKQEYVYSVSRHKYVLGGGGGGERRCEIISFHGKVIAKRSDKPATISIHYY